MTYQHTNCAQLILGWTVVSHHSQAKNEQPARLWSLLSGFRHNKLHSKMHTVIHTMQLKGSPPKLWTCSPGSWRTAPQWSASTRDLQLSEPLNQGSWTEWRNAEKNVSNMRVEQKGKHPNHKLSLRSDTGLWRSLKIRFEKKELIDLTADRPFLASSKTLGQEHSDHSFFWTAERPRTQSYFQVFSTTQEHGPCMCPCADLPMCLCRSRWSCLEKQKANGQNTQQVQDDTRTMQ